MKKLDEVLKNILEDISTSSIFTSGEGSCNPPCVGENGNKAPNPNDDFYNRGDSRIAGVARKKRKKK